MIGKETTDNFLAETEVEESLMLMGRVNALRGIWAVMPAQINAKLVNAIFQFGPEVNEEVEKANKDKAMYWEWYVAQLKKAEDLQKQLNELNAEKEDE